MKLRLFFVLLSAFLLPSGFSSARAQEDAGELFSISVDGEHVAGTVPAAPAGKASSTLEAADIQVKYDGLGVKPVLNVTTAEQRQSYAAGEAVAFRASSNYPAYIARQDIRIFAIGLNAPAHPVAVLKVDAAGSASWTMPDKQAAQGFGEFAYVLRAYDGQGRFDETSPLMLSRREAFSGTAEQAWPAPGFGEDNTAFRNIPVDGGAVTVSGRDLGPGVRVRVLGEEIPVDEEGRFAVQRILPVGQHQVDVRLAGAEGGSVDFGRSINIPSSEWFYVGLADVTLGSRSGSRGIEDVKPGEYDGVYDKGRLSFYLKGKVKGSWLLTAAADTGETSLGSLFTGLDDKRPRSFLKRIDPEDYYPVYGDDSSAVEDAPTRGKFYVRLERGDSRVLWGNFRTDIQGTEFLRNERALYGASLVMKSGEMAPSGERRGQLDAYAAQPGTLPQRDVFRGTGGSAYFLSRRDITVGSETVTIELRNKVTGMAMERRRLAYGQDYTIDYLQGVVLLKEPLSPFADGGRLIHDGTSGDREQFLIAAYEFTPATGEVDGYVYGGRAQQWIGDHVRVGVTGALEKTGAADQKLLGADVQLYHSERTFLEGEVSRSEGPGFGFSESIDGGLTIDDSGMIGAAGKSAMAARMLGRADAADVLPGAKGDLEVSYAYKQKGFATLDETVEEDRHEIALRSDLALSERVALSVHGDQLSEGLDPVERQGGASLAFAVSDDLSLIVGGQQMSVDDDKRKGNRTDLGAKIERRFGEEASVYVFGQGTLARSGTVDLNNRAGVGGTRALSDTTDASGEVSYGSGGIGARALLSYESVAGNRYYIGYALDPESRLGDDLLNAFDGEDLGGIVAGVQHGFSERLSVYAEDRYDFLGGQPKLSQVYGVTYTPEPGWTLGGSIVSGQVLGGRAGLGLGDQELNRTAFSASATYQPDEKFIASLKGELRFDTDRAGDDGDVTGYYLAGRLGHALNEDWRFLASADVVLSDASETTREGDYVETSLGYAYRPAENDRLNALLKYVFLYDAPGADQVSVDGSKEGPSQLSHIFSADANYDVTPLLTIGGKYGLRIGEWKAREAGSDWESSTAQLAVARADLHVVKNWDVLLETRGLWESVSGTVDFGALAAIYRQLGDHLEVGVGYNFGRFSDDLRDLTADDHGVFVNMVGKI